MVGVRRLLGHLRQHGHADPGAHRLHLRGSVVLDVDDHRVPVVLAQHEWHELRQRLGRRVVVVRWLLGHV